MRPQKCEGVEPVVPADPETITRDLVDRVASAGNLGPMRAIVLRESGPADNLRLEEIEAPTATPGHVIVEVHAEGVCFRDVVERRGGFAFQKRPVVPGHEFAGRVVEVGEGVTGLAVGDEVVNLHRAPCGVCEMCRAGHEPRCTQSLEVFGLTVDGGYAQRVRAAAGCLVPRPKGIPPEHACFLNCTAAVALRALRTIGRLQPGEHVAIPGASGGVGLHAIQVAKVLGARVTAVTGRAAKEDLLREYGADDVVVADGGSFHKELGRRTRGRGVDLVLDCVGEPTFNASLRSLRPLGRLVVVGNVTSDRVQLNAGFVILSEIVIAGSAGCSRADLHDVLTWVQNGRVRPVVADVLPLHEAPDAHRRLEDRDANGRIVLRP